MTAWAQVLVVARKELRDALRDRRALLSALLMPILGPAMIAAMFTVLAGWTRQDKPLRLPISHAERAPNLVAFLERNNVELIPVGEDAEGKVRDGTLELALIVTPGYAEDFRAGRTAKVELLMDNSRNKARMTVMRTQRLLRGFSSQLGALRLLARGVSPALAMPVQIEEVDLSTPEKLAANLLGSVPIFLLMSVFLAGMYLAIDATAGERERGSLESLLINPAPRGAIITGKWVAAVLATWIGIAVSITGFTVAFSKVPLQDLGVKLQLGPVQVFGLVAMLVPLSFFASALQMLMALYARTFKEAQTYLSLMMMVPVIPATIAAISPSDPKTWMMAIPVLAQTKLLSEIMRGEPANPLWIALATVSSMAAAWLCLRAATALLGKEKIVFGRSG